MQFFQSVLSGKAPGNSDEVSLLADWQSYSKQSPDLEAGPGPSAAVRQDSLFGSVETAGRGMSDVLRNSFTAVSTRVNSGVTTVSTTSQAFSIPSGQQLVYFFAFLAAGALFLMLSFTIFLPTIILSPSKFAMSFTLGCLLTLAAFSILRGWQQQLQHMFSRERLPFSAAYLGSVFATLYAALILHSYLLCLACSGAQMVALLYYLLSYFPGGAQGVKFMLTMFSSAVSRGIASCWGR